ncbi:MAG: amidohydrolase [Chloroflexi bacterium]|uniref:Amidohydrolase n=1 Tax=Candidatus Chlorohelix allophototropha TaxID=3003348 RepID=A0A8T7LYS6_9CHLR|nr:amidohydrolase [Chloroflexota bacterium]WJW65476.1 amidohydrolase [Chloroflexota bacterium L227-S17]
MSQKIDLIIHNANIYTFDSGQPRAEALAIADGRIIAAGSVSDIRDLDGANAARDTLDLKGATLIPGLNDSHTHFAWWSLIMQELKLAGINKLNKVLDLVAESAEVTPVGAWLQGQGWDKNLWGDEFPNRMMLDRVAPRHPVALMSKDAHLLWVNSLALQLAGLTRDTPEVEGGEITRDAQGEPTGILKENAMSLVHRVIPEPTIEQVEAAIEMALPEAHRTGLTAVHSIEDAIGFAAFQNLRAQGKLSLRTAVLLGNWAIPHLQALGLRQGFGDEMLWLAQIKFFLDGTLGSQTAAMFEPFDNSPDHRHDNCGMFRMDPEDFERQARQAIRSGFGIAVHVIGDHAARLGLDVIEKMQREEDSGRLRNRLEHVQIVTPQDLLRFAASRIIASCQPTHATTDRDVAERYWGYERAARSYQYRALLYSGAPVAFGSDVPVESIDPRKGIFAAVSRRREGENRPAFFAQECLTVGEAIRGFTYGAAYAAGDERRRGRIAPGMLADLTALAQDIFVTPEDEIPQTPVVVTLVGGSPVYLSL